MKNICNSFLLITVLLFFFTTQLFGQQTLRILDLQSGQPIAGASFRTGQAKGQSDQNGTIHFASAGPTLEITHIGYVLVKLTGTELRLALQNGTVELQPADEVLLNPVTVFAIKGKAAKDDMKLSNGEWIQHDAGQVLLQIPGFSAMRKSGAFGLDPVFRGFKLDQINVLTNGAMTSLAACPNRMDPPTSQVLVSQVEQVDILKGPHNFRFGPVSGAVINFKTAAPEFTGVSRAFGRVNTGLESNGEIFRTEGVVGMRNVKMQIAGLGSWSKGGNYTDGNDSIIPAGFQRGSAGLQADFNVRGKNVLSFSAIRSFARDVDFPTLMMDLITDDSWMVQAEYKAKPNRKTVKGWNTQVYASFVDHLMGNTLRPEAGKMADAETAVNTTVAGGRTEWIFKTRSVELFAGLDLKHEQEDGNRVRSNVRMGPMKGKTIIDTVWQDSYITRGGMFAEWHKQLQQYKLVISGRLDAVQGDSRNPSSVFSSIYPETQKTDINPSLSIGMSRNWTRRWYSGLWLGRGLRSAGIPERFINAMQIGIDPYELLGNPQLRAEANNQADVIIGYKSAATAVQWNGFASRVTNYITGVKTNIPSRFGAPGTRKYINLDKADLYGFEFSWTQLWLPQLQQQCTMAYTHGKNVVTGEALPQIAPFDLLYSMEAKLLNGKLLPYGQLRWVAAQKRIAQDFGEPETGEFTVISLGIKSEPLKNLQFTASVNNLFDRAYREHLSRFIRPSLPLNSTGRSLAVMVSYSF